MHTSVGIIHNIESTRQYICFIILFYKIYEQPHRLLYTYYYLYVLINEYCV